MPFVPMSPSNLSIPQKMLCKLTSVIQEYMEKWPGVRETYFKLWNTFSSITQFSEIKCSSHLDLNNEQRTVAHMAMHSIQPRETCVWVALWPRANGYEVIDSRSRQQSQERRSRAAASCCLILVPCLMLQMFVYVPVYTFSSCNMCLTHPHYTYVVATPSVCTLVAKNKY